MFMYQQLCCIIQLKCSVTLCVTRQEQASRQQSPINRKTPHIEHLQSVTSRYTGDTNKWELLKNPTKIEEIQEKKFIDRK